MKRILLTGAAGFLGVKTAKKLKSSHFEVFTTDVGGDVIFKGNLVDPNFVKSLPEVDVVVHCAGVQYATSTIPFFSRSNFFQRNNITVAQNLSERYSGQISSFIFIGTSMMYPSTGSSPSIEKNDFQNNGIYSRSKILAWEILQKMNNPTSILVPCIIAGAGRQGLFSSLVQTIRIRSLAVFPGKGNTKVQMVHVDDVSSLIEIMISNKTEGIYNAGGENPLTIREWIDKILQISSFNKNVKLISIPLILLKFVGRISAWRLIAKEQVHMLEEDHQLDCSRSKSLGWRPVYTNEEIIVETARYLVSKN